MRSVGIRKCHLQAAATQHQASCMLRSSPGLHVASSGTYVLPVTPNTMWPLCSCRIIWGYPMATTYNTCRCYSPDFTLDWPSWYVTESNCVVLGQIAAAAAATATVIGFSIVPHITNCCGNRLPMCAFRKNRSNFPSYWELTCWIQSPYSTTTNRYML